jgi:thiol-disulfide isomerase/thioredoxin
MNIIPAYPAPDFKDMDKWSDGSIHSIKEFKGKAILLDFWTYTCIYCLRTIPTINKIKEKYKDNDLIIISIHSAEYDFAKKIGNIEKAISTLNLNTYLTGFDLKNKTWELYGNSYWPKHILIDKDGFVRYEHPGYGSLKDFEDAISDILEIPFPEIQYKDKEVKNEEEEIEETNITKIYGKHFIDMAPEICLGYSRIRRFGNNQKPKINEYNTFSDPNIISDNTVYLRGKWRWDKEGIKPEIDHHKGKRNTAIILRYNKASNVNVIIGSEDDKPAIAEIKIDDGCLDSNQEGFHIKRENNEACIKVTWPFIYNIVKTDQKEIHKIEIIPQSNNFYFYTFVFG